MVSKKDIMVELCLLSDELSALEARVIRLEKGAAPKKKVGRPRKTEGK